MRCWSSGLGGWAAFDEGDVYLMRSLTNQVAVTIRNARQFADIADALSSAEEAQNRYLAQAWEKLAQEGQQKERLFIQPEAPSLSESAAQNAKEQALNHNQPTLVELNGTGPTRKAIVAPVKLGSATIGAFQLHQAGNKEQIWSEQDLIFIEAVLNQLAQTAENLRLFGETRERAGRERTIREITDKLRAAPNLDALLETAARELGQRLEVRHTVLELGIESKSSDTEITTNALANH